MNGSARIDVILSVIVKIKPNVSEIKHSFRKFFISLFPKNEARMIEIPVQHPPITNRNKFMTVPEMPAAAKAEVPQKWLITIESVML